MGLTVIMAEFIPPNDINVYDGEGVVVGSEKCFTIIYVSLTDFAAKIKLKRQFFKKVIPNSGSQLWQAAK